MNLSPPWECGVLEAGIAVVQRDLAVERLVELNFCFLQRRAVVVADEDTAAIAAETP
jgi:hypothetical protein